MGIAGGGVNEGVLDVSRGHCRARAEAFGRGFSLLLIF